jgi:hypothetical protein
VADMPSDSVFHLVSSISPQRQTQIASTFGDLKSTRQYLHGDIGIEWVG